MIGPVTNITSMPNRSTDASGVGASVSSQGSFATLLAERSQALVESVRSAEATSAAGLRGESDIRAVVDTVMQAERDLQAAVAVREKIVAAYLDLTRMSI